VEQTTGETEEVPPPAAEYAGTWGDCAVRIGHERVVDVADIFEDDALSSVLGGDNIVASGAGRPSTTSARKWLSNSGLVSAGPRQPRGWRRNTHSNTAAEKTPLPTSVSETVQVGFSAPLSNYNT
jgi:hypothetical protein